MSDQHTTPAEPEKGHGETFDQRVDRCLAMVLHHAEVQQIAAVVKKVHAERSQEKGKCEQPQ